MLGKLHVQNWGNGEIRRKNAHANAFPRGMSNSQVHQSKDRPRTRTVPFCSLISQVENKAQTSKGSMELRVMRPIRDLQSYMYPSIPSCLHFLGLKNVK